MSLHNFNKIPCRKPLTVIKFLPASIHTNVNTNKMAKIVNPRDAAWQEIKSIGAFSAVLVTINELARAAGIQSPTVMMIINVVVLVANMAWQYQDNGGMERYTIDKQMSRLGVNATVFFVGLGIYGIFLAIKGGDEKDLVKHLEISGKDATWFTPFLAYIASAIVYAMNRAVANVLLLIPAAANALQG